QRRIIDVLDRVADARIEGRELLQRARLGRLVYPVVALDLVLERGEDVVDQLMHLPVALRRIVALDVDLPDALAERTVDEIDAALPTVALAGHVAQSLRVEA